VNNIHFNSRQLLAFSLLALLHGMGYLFEWIALSAGTASLPKGLLDAYSVGWICAGVWGVLCATKLRTNSRRRTARPLLGLAFAVWSSIFVVAWVQMGVRGAWFGAALYLLIAWAVVDPPSPWGLRRGRYHFWRRT
jgi:hypothetical protein